jgi:putative peptidoglycan lipid II flippase
VGLGIFLSKVAGLIRTVATAAFLGTTGPAAAFGYALRIPNLLQNLFGEGVLSASFVPAYASLLGKGENEEADKLASAVFGLFALFTSIVVLLGIVFAKEIVALIFYGSEIPEDTRALTVRLVRIIFPGTGLLVQSAWCLGVLNSHRRFFLSYVSPVVWNAAQVFTLLVFGFRTRQEQLPTLAVYLSYGVVAGSFLQFAVQIPTVLSLGRFRPSLSLASGAVRSVFRGMGPVIMSRGVVQVSAYVDLIFIAKVGEQAAVVLNYVQQLSLLPISLFGMAVSASELTEMSRTQGSKDEVAAKLRGRIDAGFVRMAYFIVPSAAAFLFLGDVVSGVLFQRGRFGADDSRYAWYMLMGSTLGLLAQTFGRLYSSAFYALRDTRTPFYFATARVALTAALAYVSVVHIPAWLGLPRLIGSVGITATTGLCAWFEFALLRAALQRRIGPTGMPLGRLFRLWAAAGFAAAVGVAIKMGLTHAFGPATFVERGERVPLSTFWGGFFLPAPHLRSLVTGLMVLLPYGFLYLGITHLMGISEVSPFLRRLARRLQIRAPSGFL